MVEGRKMALECQNSALEIERVFISEHYDGDIPFDEELLVFVSEDIMRYISDEKTPQGVICRVRIPQTPITPPTGKCLFLDGVADPGNMGTIIRTANAAGYTKVYITSDCVDAYSPKSVRASMSGIFFTEICRGERAKILSVLKGTPVIVADMGGENLFRFTPPTAYTLVIGNEGNGISPEVKLAATHTVRIPMRQTQESLNAALSAGIMMYELSREEFKTID